MFAQLPMYHRIGAAAYKADIQPTIDMMAALGNPERKFKSIHVAGTNGKGSVSHMLASILQEAGYKVGLYTSPHLVDFRERIRINGEMIPEDEVVNFVSSRWPVVGGQSADAVALTTDHRPLATKYSFFEMTVGLAFDYFAKEKVDIAVIEVGMGGRLDSTNVIMPELSVITNIGLDHTQFLGDTLEKIAAEKAGIIKEGVPVVIGETQPETKPVFLKTAAAHHAPISFADEKYRINDECGMMNDELMSFTVDILRGNSSFLTPHSSFTSQLTGEYQKKNIATVLQAVDVLRSNSSFLIPHSSLQQGLARVVTNTHLQGRWQKIGDSPLTICETAHNEPGIRAMLPKLSEILKQSGNQSSKQSHLHLVYGCVNDKDFRHIMKLLSDKVTELLSQPTTQSLSHSATRPHSWYFTQPSVPRRLPVADLAAAAHEMGIDGPTFDNVKEAIAAARAAADKDDFVLVTGSIFLVADALA